MSRSIPGAVAMLALIAATPTLAADYQELRPSYPENWEATADNQLKFEAGIRYWYSKGGQDAVFPSAFGDTNLSVRDTAHIGEVHARVDDPVTQTYLKVYGGLGFASSGNYSLVQPGIADTNAALGSNGRVGYAIGDFGWLPFGTTENGVAVGGLVGYQYWNDSPAIGRGNYAVVDSAADVSWTPGSGTYTLGFDSQTDNLDIHALRLGLSAQADINDMFDIRAEAAAIPYAWVTGTLGPHEVPTQSAGGTSYYKASATTVSGTGYGAAGELMLGVHPTENLTLRFGGRAWYVGGTLDATYKQAAITDPVDTDPATPGFEQGPTVATQNLIFQSQLAQVFRYGALFELTGRF